MSSCHATQNVAFLAFLVTIGMPTASAINGAVGPVAASEFPYVAMVKVESSNVVTPGIFLSKRYVLAEYVVASQSSAVVFTGGQRITTMARWSTSNTYFSVAKLCTSPAFNGPYYNFADSAHTTDYAANNTGKVLFYSQTGTLLGHTTDVVTNPICLSELSAVGATYLSSFVTAVRVCTKFDATDCSQMKSSSFTSHPMLAINGVVEGVTTSTGCSTSGLYERPTIYRKIMPFKTEIASFPGVVIANP